MNLGTTVWDASIVLAKYFEKVTLQKKVFFLFFKKINK